MKSGAFFPKKIFDFWWGLRPWAGPASPTLSFTLELLYHYHGFGDLKTI